MEKLIIPSSLEKKNNTETKNIQKKPTTDFVWDFCNFPNSSNSQIAASVLFPDFTPSSPG